MADDRLISRADKGTNLTYALLLLNTINELKAALSAYDRRDKSTIERAFATLLTLETISIPKLLRFTRYIEFRNKALQDYNALDIRIKSNRPKAYLILQQWAKEIIANLYACGIISADNADVDL